MENLSKEIRILLVKSLSTYAEKTEQTLKSTADAKVDAKARVWLLLFGAIERISSDCDCATPAKTDTLSIHPLLESTFNHQLLAQQVGDYIAILQRLSAGVTDEGVHRLYLCLMGRAGLLLDLGILTPSGDYLPREQLASAAASSAVDQEDSKE